MKLLMLNDLDPSRVTRQYGRVLDQLQRGDFRAAEVKKLRSGDGLYRAKLDDKNRLLFKFGVHGGETYLLILEIVLNHDYAKARFLRGGVYSEQDFEPVASPNLETPAPLLYVNPASPSFHLLDKPVSFDAAQTAVYTTPLPMVVVGPAGSGKTALTLEKLKILPGHGLYLTRSAYLVENARALYAGNAYTNDGQEIDFLSLRELIETLGIPPGREATYADFAAWYGRMRGSFKLKEPHKIFEEIKGVITGTAADRPWISEEEYVSLGVRQSIFLGDERPQVYLVFLRWLEHLRASSLFDANIVAYERIAQASPHYDFLVIDEVQDITNVELTLALATLKDRRQLLLCGDSNQIVHPNLFSWARIKKLFYEQPVVDGSPIDAVHILHSNYRNTAEVTALANRLLLVKQRRFGSIDRESHYLVESVSNAKGRVDLVADTPEVRGEIDAKTRRSTRYAVIVLRDEDKVEARQAFSTPLVFSVQEAKGLEYENVILFNLVSGAEREYRACVSGVSPADLEEGLTYNRARDKTDKALDAYKFYVNALYVAMTRAIKSLTIIERQPAHPLWQLLSVALRSARLELAKEDSTLAEWQREARRLELQGKTEQAEKIRRDILGTVPVPWTVLTAANFAQVRDKALGATPGTVATDKASQQLLFEYALTYDAPDLLHKLEAARFRHAKNPDGGRAFIEQTHYADYRLKQPMRLAALSAKHGLDFRNPLNETPLMVAAKLGRADVVTSLLDEGADAELLDNAGRSALQLVLSDFFALKQRMKPDAAANVFQVLAKRAIKIKVGNRMSKLEPRSMEWFLLNFIPVYFRPVLGSMAEQHTLPCFNAPGLSRLLAAIPERILTAKRSQRPYISGMFAKNEITGTNPYNRRIFYRVAHGMYVLNPLLEIEVKGEWRNVYDLMNLPLLSAGLSEVSMLDYFDEFLRIERQGLRLRLEREESLPQSPGVVTVVPTGSPKAGTGEQRLS